MGRLPIRFSKILLEPYEPGESAQVFTKDVGQNIRADLMWY